jgi:hypothetical protein
MAPPKPPPLIFINTDNSNSQDKLYQATKAGGATEEIIQKTIKKIVEKAADTTNTSDNAKATSG